MAAEAKYQSLQLEVTDHLQCHNDAAVLPLLHQLLPWVKGFREDIWCLAGIDPEDYPLTLRRQIARHADHIIQIGDRVEVDILLIPPLLVLLHTNHSVECQREDATVTSLMTQEKLPIVVLLEEIRGEADLDLSAGAEGAVTDP